AILGHISERAQERARAEYLEKAHQALSAGQYSEALRLLETGQTQGMVSPEISELMDFARQEADRRRKNTHIQGLLKQAQDLMARGAYRQIVELLGNITPEPETAALVRVLEDARNQLQSFDRMIQSALQAAEALRRQEQYLEAVRLLESQPPSVLEHEPVERALAALREASASENRA